MTNINDQEPAIAIIGGSGLYEIEGAEKIDDCKINTPYGDPSDKITECRIEGRRVFFLPRHGKGHTILPHELNHKANFWALKSLGVRWVIAVTAVGSLQDKYAPRDIVLPDQYFDRTSCRSEHTFFGDSFLTEKRTHHLLNAFHFHIDFTFFEATRGHKNEFVNQARVI